MTTQDLYPTRVSHRPAMIPRKLDPTVYGQAEDGPLNRQQLTGHSQDGFTSIDKLLTDSELRSAQQELRSLLTDPRLDGDERVVREKNSQEIRSIFDIHHISEEFRRLIDDERLAGVARQILGSQVYIHQSRVNYKPGFGGNSFYWHSDFETWHAEDGMPRMRAVSLSIALTDNYDYNGSLMIMPGSHRTFVSCVGDTPEGYYRTSLQEQEIGTPDTASLRALADRHGIRQFTGPAGSGLWFDANCMHGSNGNITPYPRSNLFIVFNSVENALVEPFAAPQPRPTYLGARTVEPIGSPTKAMAS
ncbi:ectoine hydroxylase [Natronoglycomyces albus]|uniref:Ectoine hydroxylase n=1 Tax=Natronoglycomyces albus TaxID=2811108 RepID=A0A895XNE7_9ACTN|nr:ectoine hydroxylase [Natronoglycomyces albus]QSB04575.1 ectoine hydroxylase [Natronoglycomyces albus]